MKKDKNSQIGIDWEGNKSMLIQGIEGINLVKISTSIPQTQKEGKPKRLLVDFLEEISPQKKLRSSTIHVIQQAL